MVESLPDKWKTAWMEAEVSEKEISAEYFYTSGFLNKQSKFKTDNVFAPMNAMKAIQEIMASEGQNWSKAKFFIKKDGTFEFTPIA